MDARASTCVRGRRGGEDASGKDAQIVYGDASTNQVSYEYARSADDVLVRVDASEMPSVPIIVLGQSLQKDGQPSRVLRNRVELAADLHRRMGAPLVVSGGDVAKVGETEAAVMRRLLLEAGVAVPSSILLEAEARNTLENALHVVPLLQPRAPKTVVLLTSDFHVPRAALLFVGAFEHRGFYPRIICIGARSEHPRRPARTPRPWETRSGGDISSWHMAERCEHEQRLLNDTMPRWFASYGIAQPASARFAAAAAQLREVSNG